MNIPDISTEDVMTTSEGSKKCAPHLKFESGSCMTADMLYKLANAYNKEQGNEKIRLDKSALINVKSKYKKYLLKELKQNVGGNQTDWIKSAFAKKLSKEDKAQLEHNTFRPKGPQGQYDWLSTLDINYTMQQYENKYNDFKFLGAVPIDFNDLDYYPFKNMNFDDFINKNKHRIGVVFNLDRHDQGGSHWVSLYSDLKEGKIYFSDSVGKPPKKPIKDFMDRIKNHIETKNKYAKVDMRHNETEHQKGNSECGVYSINWILRLLKGKSFDHLTRKRLSDDQVNQCRVVYFNKK